MNRRRYLISYSFANFSKYDRASVSSWVEFPNAFSASSVPLDSLTVSVDDGGTWDLDEKLPKYIKVSCGFTYIGDELPQMGMKHYATNLIGKRNK